MTAGRINIESTGKPTPARAEAATDSMIRVAVEGTTVVSEKQLALMLGVSRRSIRRWATRDDFPTSFMVYGCRRWRLTQIRAFIEKKAARPD